MEKFCDRCGRPVTPLNDALRLALRENRIAKRISAIQEQQHIEQQAPRHLLPIMEDEVQVCPGSPSLAQYLPEQPRDLRPQYAYQEHLVEQYRRAYWQLIREHKEQSS